MANFTRKEIKDRAGFFTIYSEQEGVLAFCFGVDMIRLPNGEFRLVPIMGSRTLGGELNLFNADDEKEAREKANAILDILEGDHEGWFGVPENQSGGCICEEKSNG